MDFSHSTAIMFLLIVALLCASRKCEFLLSWMFAIDTAAYGCKPINLNMYTDAMKSFYILQRIKWSVNSNSNNSKRTTPYSQYQHMMQTLSWMKRKISLFNWSEFNEFISWFIFCGVLSLCFLFDFLFFNFKRNLNVIVEPFFYTADTTIRMWM